MPQLQIEAKEPQPIQYSAKNFDLDAVLNKNETSDDSNDYFQVDLMVKGIQLPDFSIDNVDIDSTNSKLIANAGNGTFSKVRVGDTVTDSAGSIPSGTTVSSINGDESEVSLSQAPSTDESSIKATFTPQTLDATVGQLRIDMNNVNNTDIEFVNSLYTHDGTKNESNRNSSGGDDLTPSDASRNSKTRQAVNIFNFVNNVKS